MDFNMSDRQKDWLNRVQSFMTKHVRPAVPIYKQQDAEGGRWKVIPILEDLKKKAKAEGLWNMFMPPSSHEDDEFRGAGLSNLEYAPLAEEMGHIHWASEVFNCSAPDTGNMEVFIRYANKEQKRQWLKPLMNGEIRSAFLMTEPAVASSDATNIETRIVSDGDHYVINGRKWWSSGVGDPRCKIAILMGKTDPNAARHQQQSQILVPLDTPGITVEKMLPVFGFDDAPHGHAQVLLENVRVPKLRTSCSARAAASKSRRAVSVRAASITACAPSAWPKRRWKRWCGGWRRAPRSARRSSSIRSGNSASPKPAPTSR